MQEIFSNSSKYYTAITITSDW